MVTKSTMSPPNFDIKKLSGKLNYAQWARKVMASLHMQDLAYVILEDSPPQGAALNKFVRDDRKALSYIILCCDTNARKIIDNSESAEGAWNTLKELYKKKSLHSELILETQFEKIRL